MRIRGSMVSLVIAVLISGCGGAEKLSERPVPQVEVRTVEKSVPNENADVYSASVEPYSTVQLSFRAQGYVTDIHTVHEKDGTSHAVDPGDWVTSGTVLAQLRPDDFTHRVNLAESAYSRSTAGVAQAQSQLVLAQASVTTARAAAQQAKAAEEEAKAAQGQARAQIDMAQAEYEKNRLNFERASHLTASQSMTESDHDSARAACDASKARLDQAKEQYRSAQARVTQAHAAYLMACSRINEARAGTGTAQAAVEASRAAMGGEKAHLEQAKLDYSDAFLKAPMSGVILSRNIEIGNQVSPAVTAFEMADVSSVKITFGVPDLIVNTLRLGQEVSISCDAVPGTIYRGHIMTLSAGADPRERTFKVAVKVRNSNRKLRTGMIASLRLAGEHEAPGAEVITIPLSALISDPRKPEDFSVYIIEQDGACFRARLREVKTGEAIGNSIIIREGLTAGERIVTSGSNLIKDGDTVKIGE